MECSFLAGIDEAGRGPLAGPVVAGCVILHPEFPVSLLNDSKKLSEKKRLQAEAAIKELCCWGIGTASEKVIDRINILQADFLAMKDALSQMLEKLPAWCGRNGISSKADSVPGIAAAVEAIVDGNALPPGMKCRARAVVKADTLFPCVMAASILAKTERDRIMTEYGRLYPEYGYERHKGYPTPEHKELCRRLGPSPVQRLSFRY